MTFPQLSNQTKLQNEHIQKISFYREVLKKILKRNIEGLELDNLKQLMITKFIQKRSPFQFESDEFEMLIQTKDFLPGLKM